MGNISPESLVTGTQVFCAFTIKNKQLLSWPALTHVLTQYLDYLHSYLRLTVYNVNMGKHFFKYTVTMNYKLQSIL